MYKNLVKPILDLAIATITFVVTLPVFILVSIMLLIVNKGTPFFLQDRPGKNEKIFKIIKFKTMSDERDSKGNLLPDEKRLGGIGKYIRSTSIDELPQLLNVLKGEMSLVGPRPLLPEYLRLYNDFQRQRHLVKPGITGWAQVNGRNALSWDEKFELDSYYVKKISFVLDCIIILKTVANVFLRKDISARDMATTNRFKGNK